MSLKVLKAGMSESNGGSAGAGGVVPAGGTTGQVLGKTSNADGATAWLSASVTSSATVLHTNGTRTAYPPATDTNAGRGNALIAAVAAVVSGECIEVGAGTFEAKNITTTGTGLNFPAMSQVTYTGSDLGGIFDDFDGVMDITSEGGSFANEKPPLVVPDYTHPISVINISNASSVMRIRARRMGSYASQALYQTGFVLAQTNGRVFLELDEMLSGNGVVPLWWTGNGGFCDARIGLLDSTDSNGGAKIYTAVTATSTGDLFYSGDVVQCVSGAAIQHDDTHASARCWFGLGELSGGDYAITAPLGGAAVCKYYYIGCGKITATSEAATVINLTQAQWWMDWQKMTVPDLATIGLSAYTGTVKATIIFDEIECLGTVTDVIYVGGANVNLNLAVRRWTGTTTSGGILVAAGTLKFEGRIDTSLNSTARPLKGVGGVTILLRNAHLQSGASTSITRSSGSGAVTVICEGACTANVDVGANVTVIGNLTVDASFT